MLELLLYVIGGSIIGYFIALNLLKNKYNNGDKSETINLKNQLQQKENDKTLEIKSIKDINEAKINNLNEKISELKESHQSNLDLQQNKNDEILEQKKVHYQEQIDQLKLVIKGKDDDKENIVKNLTKDFKVSATEIIKEANKDTQDFSKKTFAEDKKVIEEFGKKWEGFKKTVDGYQISVSSKHQSLEKDLRAFTKAFDSKPNIRGEYGQQTLRNLLEGYGMTKHIDFLEQDKFYRGEEKLIPDCIQKLPDNRNLAIDAKAPMFHYKSAMETEDSNVRNGYLKKHAEAVRQHMKKLSEKAYWDRIKSHSPQYVVMFIPGDHFYFAALQLDHKLQEDAFKSNIIITSPSLLFGVLKIASNMWSSYYADENIKNVIGEAKELHSRWASMQDHIMSLGKAVGSVQKHFNGFVGSYSHKLLPQINRFKKYGVSSGKIIEQIEPIEGETNKVKLLTEESLKEPKIIKQVV